MRRLLFIRQAQSLGFTLNEVLDLLTLKRADGELCTTVVRSIDHKPNEVQKKPADLRAIRLSSEP